MDPLEWWEAQNRCLFRACREVEQVIEPVLNSRSQTLDLPDRQWAVTMLGVMDGFFQNIAVIRAYLVSADGDEVDVRGLAKETELFARCREEYVEKLAELTERRARHNDLAEHG